MLGAVFAPFVLAGVLAVILVPIGIAIVVIFFMLIDATFARFVILVVAAIVILSRWLGD